MSHKLTPRQRKTRRNFSKFLDGLTLSDLNATRIQRAVVSALRRVKQVDQEIEQIRASQMEMFGADTDFRARKPSLLQPDLFKL